MDRIHLLSARKRATYNSFLKTQNNWRGSSRLPFHLILNALHGRIKFATVKTGRNFYYHDHEESRADDTVPQTFMIIQLSFNRYLKCFLFKLCTTDFLIYFSNFFQCFIPKVAQLHIYLQYFPMINKRNRITDSLENKNLQS